MSLNYFYTFMSSVYRVSRNEAITALNEFPAYARGVQVSAFIHVEETGVKD